LGLFGHLNVLTIADICDYLTQGHEPTTIAVLIGVAASKIGTADPLLSKTLCLHLPSLLPAQHWDIEISPMVQCAAIIGLGFLYCRSGHRLIIQFLLEELTRRPTSDRCECRESLALAAAWALGMVLLPKDDIMTPSTPAPLTSNAAADGVHAETEHVHQYPDILKGFADLKIEDRLNLLISGGKRPPQSNLFPFHEGNHDPSAKSSKVMEGDVINVDVTGPAATVAIALIYMRSNNSKVLRRLATPSTAVELDAIRPDQLIYRALAQCIVRWEHGVEATQEWVENQIPSVLRNLLPKMTGQDSTVNSEEQGNYQGPYGASRRSYHTLQPATIFTAYMHLITGYCLGMGVVYAGTFHPKAKETLLYYLSYLQK
jgi:anaphase-promoting complex subunit 1